MLHIGDWVTQYSTGYWKIIDIIPKYADDDYEGETTSWKKGDRLGDWIILKKGFTSKMKPSNACDLVDAQWCKPVSDDLRKAIESAFCENPKAKQKFDNAPNIPKPSVTNLPFSLTAEQAASFSDIIKKLPEKFTEDQLLSFIHEYLPFKTVFSDATHILYIWTHPWDIDQNFDPFYFSPELKKYE